MVSSAAPVSGLTALDQLIESFINAKPAAQTASAIPHDIVTLSQAARPQQPAVPARVAKAG